MIRREKEKKLEDGATLGLDSYPRYSEDGRLWKPQTWFARFYVLALSYKKCRLDVTNSTDPRANFDVRARDFNRLYGRIKNKQDFERAVLYIDQFKDGMIGRKEFGAFIEGL
jgi:hypothetical protein